MNSARNLVVGVMFGTVVSEGGGRGLAGSTVEGFFFDVTEVQSDMELLINRKALERWSLLGVRGFVFFRDSSEKKYYYYYWLKNNYNCIIIRNKVNN